MGVQTALGTTEPIWLSDIEPGPSRILGIHHSDTPNLGDITEVDFGEVADVDVLVGGSPCTDLSQAGSKAGMFEGTRSGLWFSMLQAIRLQQPKIVIWENVKGALSTKASSDLSWTKDRQDLRAESEKAPKDNGRALTALGRVIGDLHAAGYQSAYTTISAAAIGAPHLRERVFVLAWRGDLDPEKLFENVQCLDVNAPEKRLIAFWDTDRDLWSRHPQINDDKQKTKTLMRSWQVFDETMPKSGFVDKEGNLWELTSDIDLRSHSLKGKGVSLLPTLSATEGSGGSSTKPRPGHQLRLRDIAVQEFSESQEQVSLFPTPRSSEGAGSPVPRKRKGHSAGLRDVVQWQFEDQMDSPSLLPTPRAVDGSSTPGAPAANRHAVKGFGSLGEVLGLHLLPTPKAGDGTMGLPRTSGRPPSRATHLATRLVYDTPLSYGQIDYGKYELAIRYWETVRRDTAPLPLRRTRTGGWRLNPEFAEWMMGLPKGWVTDPGLWTDDEETAERVRRGEIHGKGHQAQLRLIGNGVVPQQAEVALRLLSEWVRALTGSES